MIQKKIWFIWLGSDLPKKYADNVDLWKTMNEDYDVELVTDDEMIDDDQFREAFDTGRNVLDKADALRYFLLFKFGGVYADCDTRPLKPLRDVITATSESSCSCYDHSAMKIYGNFFMFAPAGDTVFRKLISTPNASVYKYNLNMNFDNRESFQCVPVNTPQSEDVEDAILYHEYANPARKQPKMNRRVVHTPRKDRPSNYLLNDAEYEERLASCIGCEFLTDNGICKKCGCSQKNKSRIRSVHCPIDKW